MTAPHVTSPDGPIYRIAYKPEPWLPTDYDPECPPKNRFDDPEKRYKVLYASSSVFGCYVETLARFRRKFRASGDDAPQILALEAELEQIDGTDDVPARAGIVPRAWFEPRILGVASSSGSFADVCHSSWLAVLRVRLTSIPKDLLDDDDVTLATIFRACPRTVTQQVSRLIWGDRSYAGIRYVSKWGEEIVCWAVLEPFDIEQGSTRELSVKDRDFLVALGMHGLTLQA